MLDNYVFIRGHYVRYLRVYKGTLCKIFTCL